MAISHNHLSRTRPQIALLSGWLQRHTIIARAALFFMLALGLRLYRLGAQSLWLDEGGTWAEITGRTGKGWLALIAELWSKDAGYPLYHVLLKAWVGLAGDSEWALRFPSALAGAAAAVMIYLAGLELERHLLAERAENREWRMEDGRSYCRDLPFSILHPRCGSVAALLFATSPFALWYAQDAKVYSLLLLMIAVELWALLRALRSPSPRAWLLLVGV